MKCSSHVNHVIFCCSSAGVFSHACSAKPISFSFIFHHTFGIKNVRSHNGASSICELNLKWHLKSQLKEKQLGSCIDFCPAPVMKMVSALTNLLMVGQIFHSCCHSLAFVCLHGKTHSPESQNHSKDLFPTLSSKGGPLCAACN